VTNPDAPPANLDRCDHRDGRARRRLFIYIALFTGFYVDNGPNLPVWDRLPSLAYWVLPSLVGVPLILRALARRRLVVFRRAPRGRPGSGAQPGRPG
jgi:hypothetical protein